RTSWMELTPRANGAGSEADHRASYALNTWRRCRTPGPSGTSGPRGTTPPPRREGAPRTARRTLRRSTPRRPPAWRGPAAPTGGRAAGARRGRAARPARTGRSCTARPAAGRSWPPGRSSLTLLRRGRGFRPQRLREDVAPPREPAPLVEAVGVL